MIEKTITTVYYAPTRGRRYFSKNAAINAEARVIVLRDNPFDIDEYQGREYTKTLEAEDPELFNELVLIQKMRMKGMIT